MALDYDGSSYYSAAELPHSGTPPFTMATWFWADADARSDIMSIHDLDGTHRHIIRLQETSKTVRIVSTDGGGSGVADSTAAWGTGAWHHAGGVFASTTSRLAYLDGANSAEDTTSVTPASLSDTSLGTSFASSVATNPHNGRLAESAIWNAALTAAEMASLGAGFSPLCIRPSALVAYWPQLQLLDPVHDRFGSTLDETGTVVLTAHPRIIYPTGPQVAAFS